MAICFSRTPGSLFIKVAYENVVMAKNGSIDYADCVFHRYLWPKHLDLCH